MPDVIAKPGRSGFMPELDGLRAVAILLVFLVHVRGLVPATKLPILLIQVYLGLGWVGVDLFFVLSGFLITGILLDTREARNYFRGFYARRTLRIFPLYYSVLTAVILIGMWINTSEVAEVLPLPADRWLYFTYLTNWLGLWKAHWGPDYANFLAHFWSLAVEEQFYLVWPLMVWLIPSRFLPRVAAALAVTAAIVRWIWVLHSGEQVAISLATVCRMDSLFVGAIAACIVRNAGVMQRIRTHLSGIATLSLGAFLCAFSTMLFLPRQADGFSIAPRRVVRSNRQRCDSRNLEDIVCWPSVSAHWSCWLRTLPPSGRGSPGSSECAGFA
jgi:peptidoglycan/LPS O-acetylase OafA/YrhL